LHLKPASGNALFMAEAPASSLPVISMKNPDPGTDAKIWDTLILNTGVLQFRAVNDAYSSATAWLQVARSGAVGTRAIFGCPIDLSENTYSQSSPLVAARYSAINSNGPNHVEFGHNNSAGYGCNIGANTGNGVPFLAFNSEGDNSNANKFKTRGLKGSIITSDLSGGFIFLSATSTNAGNQTGTTIAQLTTGGDFSATTLAASGQASKLGGANGSYTSPTHTNTNLLLYDNSSTNWSGIGSHTGGEMYFVTGTSSPVTRMLIDTSGNVSIGAVGSSGYTEILNVGGKIAVISANATTANVLRLWADSTQCMLEADKASTGSYVDLNFTVNGSVQYKMKTDGRFLVGLSTSDVSTGANVVTSGSLVAVTGTANASVTTIGVVAGTYSSIAANRTGSGTFLPMAFFVNNAERMRINTSGELCIGGSSGGNKLSVESGSIAVTTSGQGIKLGGTTESIVGVSATRLEFYINSTKVHELDTTNNSTDTCATLYFNGSVRRVKIDNSDLGSGAKNYMYLA
jgi:hypothetical protein